MECTLYLAEGCNLRCTYCYEGNDKRTGLMNIKTMERALKFIVDNSLEDEKIHIVFLGGEPLLNISVLLYAIKRINTEYQGIRDKFFLEMTTNGVLLDENIMNIAAKEKINLSISIDGAKHTQMINRKSADGKDIYKIILQNLNRMIEMDMRFNVRMTVSANNVKYMYDNIRYFYKMGVKRINLSFDYFAVWRDNDLSILKEQMYLLDALYIKDFAFSKDKMINLFDFKYTTFLAKRPIVFCSAGTIGHFAVNASGEIFPCSYVVNARDWKIGTIWTGIDSSKCMERIRKYVGKIHECQKCPKAFSCLSTRCGFLNYKNTGLLNKPKESTCKLESILFEHNLAVMRQLFDQQCPRLMEYVKIAIDNKIEPNECMKYMFD